MFECRITKRPMKVGETVLSGEMEGIDGPIVLDSGNSKEVSD